MSLKSPHKKDPAYSRLSNAYQAASNDGDPNSYVPFEREANDYAPDAGDCYCTLDEFLDHFEGQNIRAIRKEVKRTFSHFHYMEDPANPGKYLDMKHMLIAGAYTTIGGNFYELKQWLEGNPSGFKWQDLYSNSLGYDFYNKNRGLLMIFPNKATSIINEYIKSGRYINY